MKQVSLGPVPGCSALAVMSFPVDDRTYQGLILSNYTALIATTFTHRQVVGFKVLTVRTT